MKWMLFTCLFIGCKAFSQVSPWNVNIPSEQCSSTASIASYITTKFTSENSRVAAIYSWVASNIKYDNDSANNINLGPNPEAKITEALRRRKGVCENFAAIFNDICSKAGITSVIVDGYTKQNNIVDRTGHAWCAVKLDNQWQLCDPTWDAGGNSKWFCMAPDEMIRTHMPFDPMWQLLEHPVSHRQFDGAAYDNKTPLFNYRDTINAWLKLDSLQRFRATAYRIQQAGLYNNLVKSRHDYTKMNIEIMREDHDVDLYDKAVSNLNEVTTAYNKFIRLRNDQFKPLIGDEELVNILKGTNDKISSALASLDEIAKTEALYKFSTDDLRNRLETMDGKIKEQQSFLRSYLSAPKGSRDSLFYSAKGIAGK